MDLARTAAAIGLAASVAVVLVTTLPYVLADPSVVGVYYGGSPVGPPLAALFAIISFIVILAGVTGRSDPAMSAGAGMVIGLFVALISWWWALTVDPQAAASVSTADTFQHHRWLLGFVALAIPAATGWYARSLF